jgi:hypothetical protein
MAPLPMSLASKRGRFPRRSELCAQLLIEPSAAGFVELGLGRGDGLEFLDHAIQRLTHLGLVHALLDPVRDRILIDPIHGILPALDLFGDQIPTDTAGYRPKRHHDRDKLAASRRLDQRPEAGAAERGGVDELRGVLGLGAVHPRVDTGKPLADLSLLSRQIESHVPSSNFVIQKDRLHRSVCCVMA